MKRTCCTLVILAASISVLALPAGRWVNSDMHKHTGSSGDGSGTAMETSANGMALGLNFQLITDHDNYGEFLNGNIDSTNKLYASKDFYCDIGIEYMIYSHFNIAHINPPGPLPTSWPSGSKYQWSSEKHLCHWADSMGAWIQLNHPAPPAYADPASFSYRIWGLDTLIQFVQEGLRGFEAFNGGNSMTWNQSHFIWQAGGWWDQILCQGYRFCALSGTDYHGNTLYNGAGANRVYILGDSVCPEAYWEAMFAGRFYMTADFHSGAPRAIAMNVTAGDSMMGSIVTLTDDHANVRVEAAADTAYARTLGKNVPKLDTLRVISNGAIIAELYPNRVAFDSTFEVPVDSAAYVRVETGARNLTNSTTVRGLSNPIYFVRDMSTGKEKTSSPSLPPVLEVFPNPFNPMTRISIKNYGFQITNYELKIFNIHGKLIKDLTQNIRHSKFVIHSPRVAAGEAGNSITWNASSQSSGIYVVRALVNGNVLTRQITLVK